MKFFLDAKVEQDLINKCVEITGLEPASDIDEAEVVFFRSNPSRGKNTMIMQRLFAGTDDLKLNEIPTGIAVLSNAGAFNEPVAETVFALILAHVKEICTHNTDMHKGIYKKLGVAGIFRKKMGIIGFGGIGKQVAKLAAAFGMEVYAFSRTRKEADGIQWVDSLTELAQSVDIAVVCTPLSDQTKSLINADFLSAFRGDMIVNIARANVVDERDMLLYLKENPDKFYLSDVWWNEPDIKTIPPENCIVTPHVGGMGASFRNTAITRAFESVRRYLDGDTSNVVKHP